MRTIARPRRRAAAQTPSGSAPSSIGAAPPDSREHPAEHRPEQRAEREVQEIDDAGRRAADLGRVGFLDDGVRQHRRARGDAGDESEHVRRKHAGRAEENPGEADQQQHRATDDDRLPPAEPIRDEARAADSR